MKILAHGRFSGEILGADQVDDIVASTLYPPGATHRGEVVVRVTCRYVPLGGRLPSSRLDVGQIARVMLDALKSRGVLRCRRDVVKFIHEDKRGPAASVTWTVSPYETPQPTRQACDLIPVEGPSKGVRRGN